MDSLLFLAVMIGTAWLCIWVLQDHRGPNRPWSPFDARHIGDPRQDASRPVGRRVGPPPRPWRRAAAPRGAAGRPDPEPPPWRRRSDS
jgi:hypothetical protein